MLSQKDAVYQATMAVLEQNNVEFQDGQDIREAIKDNLRLRGQIRELVFEALKVHEVVLGRGSDRDDRSMRTYATGLISNWFRKDKRLNGNKKYQPKSSHANTEFSIGEGRIRTLKEALKATDDDDLKARLEEEIQNIEEEVKLNDRLASDVKAGRFKDEEDDFDQDQSVDRSSSRTVNQDNPPSMGSGHKGAVIDPEHDARLKRNETPELLRSRQEAGHKGGLSRSGQVETSSGPGGNVQEPQGHNDGNIFKMMLRKKAS